jgi:predicted Rossmann fold flavoprotein
MKEIDVLVVGAGAAGCFAAIQTNHFHPSASVVILEKSLNALSKVRISGGGRCNVTNVISDPQELSLHYPRGQRFLKKAFHQFSSNEMKLWLEKHNVKLRLYPDGCYFPESNTSETIISLFQNELKRAGTPIEFQQGVTEIRKEDDSFIVTTNKDSWRAKNVICTTGGHPKISGFSYLSTFDLKLVDPVPSLFTFNLPDNSIVDLMGIVKEEAIVRLAGEKWSGDGPLLVTHWGLSGPAILKCSAFGARILSEKGYEHEFVVNWTGGMKPDMVSQELIAQLKSQKQIGNTPQFGIKSRLWNHLLERSSIPVDASWVSLSTKSMNRLTETLVNCSFKMKGKTTFKEEFVTAGGVDLSEIDVQTMQAKRIPGLFFAGEIMDIDGVTGGFNFQAAWTTAFIAGKSIKIDK